MGYNKELLELELEVYHETGDAVLVTNESEGDDPVWLPKSQIEIIEEDGVILVPRWLVEAKDLDWAVV